MGLNQALNYFVSYKIFWCDCFPGSSLTPRSPFLTCFLRCWSLSHLDSFSIIYSFRLFQAWLTELNIFPQEQQKEAATKAAKSDGFIKDGVK